MIGKSAGMITDLAGKKLTFPLTLLAGDWFILDGKGRCATEATIFSSEEDVIAWLRAEGLSNLADEDV